MKKLIEKSLNLLLDTLKDRKYSHWFDVGCFEDEGKYSLVQMKYDLRTNKKVFRRASIGWVKYSSNKSEIYEKTKKHNACTENSVNYNPINLEEIRKALRNSP